MPHGVAQVGGLAWAVLELGMYMVLCVRVLNRVGEKSGWQGGLGLKCSVGVINRWPKERVLSSDML